MSDELEPISIGAPAPPAGAADPAPPRPSRWRRPLRRGGAGLLGASLVVGLVAVLVGGNEPGPDEQLAAVRSFLAEAQTARFEAAMSLEAGGDGDLGQRFTQKMRGTGALVMPDRSRWVFDAGEVTYEVVVTPEGYYDRSADTAAELAGERWSFTPTEEDGSASEDLAAGGMLGAFGDSTAAMGILQPDELRRVVNRLRDPERTSGGAIRAELPLSEVFDPEDVEDVEGTLAVELTAGQGGRLDRVVWRLAGRSTAEQDPEFGDPFAEFRLDLDVAFSRWGEPAEVDAPDEADVDAFDNSLIDIDEKALAAYDDTALVGPGDLPPGYRLTRATLATEYDDEGDEVDPVAGCQAVDLEYSDPVAYEAWLQNDTQEDDPPPDLMITLTPAGCERDDGVGAGEPYAAGEFPGRIWRSHASPEEQAAAFDPSISAEVTVGTTLVEAYSALPQADITRALASLAPLDLAAARNPPAPA